LLQNSIMLSILIKLAYKFWPELYKKRFFKSLNSLKTNQFKCEPELLYLQSVLKSDATFIDVGTNKGIYLYQAEKIIKTGNIIGFEPNKKMVDFASHLFKTSKIYPLAISSKKGIATLYIPKKDNNLQDTRASLEEMTTNVEKIAIETVILDEWVLENKIDVIHIIKIDVEGHEFDAIKGCKMILQKIKPILIIEIELRHAKYPIQEIFEFIKNHDYSVHYFDRKTLKPQPFNAANIADFQKDAYLNNFNTYINNFIFIPNS
jgi:FkbM family methyltransferase